MRTFGLFCYLISAWEFIDRYGPAGCTFPQHLFGGSQLECHLSGLPTVQVNRSTKARLGGLIVALLVTKWGLAMSKDEEIRGRDV
jgi:hypothetical protein